MATLSRYKNKWVSGVVISTQFSNNTRTWKVKFKDGYIATYERARLKNILTRAKRETIGRQLDYIMVSTRWKSCVTSCRSRWGPSIRRSLHGVKSDHALVECEFKWRIRTVKTAKCKDYACLYKQTFDERGEEIRNQTLDFFDDEVRCKMIELRFDHELDNTTQLYNKMCAAISHAVDTVLPDCVKQGGVKREVSEGTKALYDERVKFKGQGTKEQYDDVQARIKKSSLQDFEAWVAQCAEGISAAEAKGNTKSVYDGVKVLAQKKRTAIA